MSDRECSNLNRNGNHINASDDMMRQFERLLADMGDRLGRLDTSVTNLSRGQWGKHLMLGGRVEMKR